MNRARAVAAETLRKGLSFQCRFGLLAYDAASTCPHGADAKVRVRFADGSAARVVVVVELFASSTHVTA